MGFTIVWEWGVCIYGTLGVPNNYPFGMVYGQPKHKRGYSKPAHIVIIN